MRHRYDTRGVVLARSPQGEANSVITILSPELGLVRARAQGLRRPGAKLAAALPTFAESSLILVHGKEGWRIAGAVLRENWFKRLPDGLSRARAGRIAGLVARYAPSEANDDRLFPIFRSFIEALTELSPREQENAEVLAALRILAALGLDAGDIPGDDADFSPVPLQAVETGRTAYVSRINRGIAASDL